jgi:hypothetical protein
MIADIALTARFKYCIFTKREAMRRAERPGLPIMNLVATATTDSSLISALNSEFGARSSDGVLVCILAELKTKPVA